MIELLRSFSVKQSIIDATQADNIILSSFSAKQCYIDTTHSDNVILNSFGVSADESAESYKVKTNIIRK
ncbi:MAG: hypothetical protein IKY54_03010 [Muribaculaceae bacterium]|nr:hypothetical protein [Muribaculaceae bacterium]